MMRLILVLAFVAVLAIAFTAVLGTLQAIAAVAVGKDQETMPDKFKRVSYVLLVILLFGVASGWLGGT